MFDVLEKLLALRQVSFDKGRIKIFEQPSSLIPSESFVSMLKELEKEGKENVIYRAGKHAGEKWFDSMREKSKLNVDDVAKWGSNIVTLAGWGEAELKEMKRDDGYMVYNLKNSVVAELYGKTNHCVDHIFRGLVAGAAKVTFKRDVDCVETKCVAKGDPICEFIIQPKQRFDKKNPLVKKQLK
ncbi:MAG: V4R domain-containing protein [archaeon]